MKYHIRFMTKDFDTQAYPIYFTRYDNACVKGAADSVHFRDSFLYAKKFRSRSSAERMLEKIRKNLDSGKAKSVWNVGHGKVEQCE